MGRIIPVDNIDSWKRELPDFFPGNLIVTKNNKIYITDEMRGVKPMPSTKPENDSQVSHQLGEIFKSLNELGETIGDLENRLANVLQPDYPTTKEPTDELETPSVPLAADLCDLSDRISTERMRLVHIIQRLEN